MAGSESPRPLVPAQVQAVGGLSPPSSAHAKVQAVPGAKSDPKPDIEGKQGLEGEQLPAGIVIEPGSWGEQSERREVGAVGAGRPGAGTRTSVKHAVFQCGQDGNLTPEEGAERGGGAEDGRGQVEQQEKSVSTVGGGGLQGSEVAERERVERRGRKKKPRTFEEEEKERQKAERRRMRELQAAEGGLVGRKDGRGRPRKVRRVCVYVCVCVCARARMRLCNAWSRKAALGKACMCVCACARVHKGWPR